jgi:transcriptional regulator with XRE-family HTH domain
VSVNRKRLKKEVGGRIYALRMGKKLTQAQLTEKITDFLKEPLSLGTVGRWEKGTSLPGVDYLLALAALFDTSLEELVMGQDAFEERVAARVLSRVEPRIERIEKHVGL